MDNRTIQAVQRCARVHEILKKTRKLVRRRYASIPKEAYLGIATLQVYGSHHKSEWEWGEVSKALQRYQRDVEKVVRWAEREINE